MTAAILIWASQTKAIEGPKENSNEPMNYVTKTTSQRVQQYIPEFFIMAWLCGNIHKFLISVLNVKTAYFHLFMSKSVQAVNYKHAHPH
jgi:hypothetical protein